MAGRFLSFVKSYSSLFTSYRKDVSDKARHYLCGLMQAGTRKNMERMVEVVPESDHQAIQQFISDSRWDARTVMDQVAQDADELIGDEKNAFLLIDETCFAKKGKKSVGVARQWLGRFGKVDNGQVAVFVALCNGNSVTPTDVRLYLPEKWTDDEERCLAAKIPKEKIVFKTKKELALEMVEHARKLGLRFGCVGADGGYGKELDFCYELEDMEETFMVDVHKDQVIYLENPLPYVPTWSGRGRKPSKLKTEVDSIRVDKWALKQRKSRWRKITVRQSTKGPLTYEFLHERIWVWDKAKSTAKHWHLIIRRDSHTQSDYKYSLSNAPASTSVKRLAFMQSQRYWIERTFEDAKSESGMADYQLRGWVGWHHHMSLVMMAMLFMLTERISNKDEYPLLSCSDIETLLAHFLPRRDITVDAVLNQLDIRHKQRLAAIESSLRKRRRNQRKPPGQS